MDSPVVIKEAALDSPTFRATAVHFGDQIDLIERWLITYVTAVAKLASEMNALQSLVDQYVQASHPPLQLSEAVLDHDYTVLALKRFGEGAREFWNSTLRGMKRAETTVCEPVRGFLNNDLRMLKEARKNLDNAQRIFDGAIARYAGQAKTKEPSSLREDAFQLHEARKEYLKASMNFCVLAPQVRSTLDKILVKVVTEQWRDMKTAREGSVKNFAAWSADVDRVRGWSKEMENGERVFNKWKAAQSKQHDPHGNWTATQHPLFRISALRRPLPQTLPHPRSQIRRTKRLRSRVGYSSAPSQANLQGHTGFEGGSS